MELKAIKVQVPDGCNVIMGQTHFIKTAEDLFEILAVHVPQGKFGLAFTEASGPCLIRCEGNDLHLIDTAVANMEKIGAGHVFIIVMKDAFPVSVLNAVKNCTEVCSLFCATANPLEVIVIETGQGRGILGVVDGSSPKGVENGTDREKRREFLKTIGYKR
ncbi:MAG: adenosine-specific kinase [Nitrospiraceae bacterium]|nr:MAG: adenosine-specific kinase [Nitrospiraceae bacterium]